MVHFLRIFIRSLCVWGSLCTLSDFLCNSAYLTAFFCLKHMFLLFAYYKIAKISHIFKKFCRFFYFFLAYIDYC